MDSPTSYHLVPRFDRLEAAHFGHHGKTRFHTGFLGNRYIRIFRSNPHIADGEVLDTREGLLDIQFLVDANIRDNVLRSLEEQSTQLARDGKS